VQGTENPAEVQRRIRAKNGENLAMNDEKPGKMNVDSVEATTKS
jgi:hypothetical protein